MSENSWLGRYREEQPPERSVRRAERLSPNHEQVGFDSPPGPDVLPSPQQPIGRSPSELGGEGGTQRPSGSSEEAPRRRYVPSQESFHLGPDLPSNAASLERRNEEGSAPLTHTLSSYERPPPKARILDNKNSGSEKSFTFNRSLPFERTRRTAPRDDSPLRTGTMRHSDDKDSAVLDLSHSPDTMYSTVQPDQPLNSSRSGHQLNDEPSAVFSRLPSPEPSNRTISFPDSLRRFMRSDSEPSVIPPQTPTTPEPIPPLISRGSPKSGDRTKSQLADETAGMSLA